MNFPVYNNDCILFKCSPSIPQSYNSNSVSNATVLKNEPVYLVVKTRKTAKILRPYCGNTYTVKLYSSAHAQVIAFQKYLAEKKRYETCVDRHNLALTRKADELAGKMFRGL